MTFLNEVNPPLDEVIEHFGVKGMHWGVRKDYLPGVSNSVNRDAKKHAEEFTRAKLFYGQGAGTRRKLIKAKVESKSARDPAFKRAFDHHVANTDLSKRSVQATRQRKRKDVTQGTAKTARGIGHIINGNSRYASAVAALLFGGAMYAHKAGIDKIVLNTVKKSWSEITMSDSQKLGRDAMRRAGFKV